MKDLWCVNAAPVLAIVTDAWQRALKSLHPRTRQHVEADGLKVVRTEQQSGYHPDEFDWIEVDFDTEAA